MAGYTKVAHLMSRHKECGIVRRFSTLNIKNLLYLQAEIIQLESELEQLVSRDATSPHQEQRHFEKYWPLLSDPVGSGHNEQWGKMLQIREKLKEYNHYLIQNMQLSKAHRPSQYDLKFLKAWLKRPDMGDFPIRSPDGKAWSSEYEWDLVALHDDGISDPFTSFVSHRAVPLYHRLLGKHHEKPVSWDPDSGVYHYRGGTIDRVVDVVSIVGSCLLPVLSIVALYLVKNMGIRLAVMGVFTAIFSLCLALLTSARKVEVFAATTAFAAIQVVFIGTNGG